jgi:hypothetical protein
MKRRRSPPSVSPCRTPKLDKDTRERGSLTKAELRCLRRTRLAQDFGKRIIDPRELIGVFDGPRFQDAVWDRLKAKGFVANGRGISVRLTKKGEKALDD